ncbi:MAG TPA: CRISPR-associated endonuclease Cas1 [Myxococcales bacterium]|nr:CRISPR-associated endonuclease Cas1 [Myxococcales bacterium]
MRTAYIAQTGASLRRQGGLLQVFVKREKVAELPARELEQLVLLGNVVLTPAALDLVVERGIDTVMLTMSGRFRGRIVGGPSHNVKLRLAQYGVMSEPARCLSLAQRVVEAKVFNQRALLMRFARSHGKPPRIEDAARRIEAVRVRSRLSQTLDEVRGCEGAASAVYFGVFGELIRVEGFRFDGRNRRPPMDPVNALLSLGYTLLLNAVEAAINIVGLDPYLGALHAPEAGRPSLACDLVEEHRAPLIDALVVAAINQGAIQPGDFEESGPGEPVVMRREAVRAVVELFERRMERQVRYEPQQRKLSWRQVLEQQARRLAREVLGEKEYEGVRMR